MPAHTPTIVITGATSGLGRLAALDLAAQGARLVITARSAERAEATREAILRAAPESAVDVVFADLTVMQSVRDAGAEIAERHGNIDVLINNAGVHAFEQRVTVDGLPEMMAVNYLAPWILTRALLPSLLSTPGSRVVTVASEASRRHGTLVLPADLTDTAPFTARGSSPLYGKSKLLDIMFSLELARRLEGTGVTANCLDPGFNVTGLGRELGFAARLEKVLTRLHIGDPSRGAGLIVALATSTDFDGVTGGYFSGAARRRLTPTHPADDPSQRRRLWEITEELVDGLRPPRREGR